MPRDISRELCVDLAFSPGVRNFVIVDCVLKKELGRGRASAEKMVVLEGWILVARGVYVARGKLAG